MRDIKITASVTDRTEASLGRYLNELSSIEVLKPQEEIMLAQKIRTGDIAAEQKLITANLRFVVSCAKKYQHFGLSLSDLICEGNIGLIKAARRFDETRGFKFISYAVWWIRQSMILAIGEHKRIIRLPMNQQLGMSNLRTQASLLEQQLEREPSLAELAELTGKSETQLADFIFCNAKVNYLQDLIPGATENNTLLEYLPDTQTPDHTAEWMLQQEQQYQIDLLLNRLKPRERKIIRMSFGIGTTPLIEEDLAREMQLSKERIRQIKSEAVKKLRQQVSRSNFPDGAC